MVEPSAARQFPAWLNSEMENRLKPEEVKCDTSTPNFELEIEHVYGYRANDCSNNLHYNASGEAVFMAAAVGIVMNTDTRKQKIYGGKEVTMGPKNVGEQTHFHRDDILCLDVSPDRKLVVTGQQGNTPSVHVWSADTCEQVATFELPAGSRGVEDVSISPCGRYVCCVDQHNNHRVTIYNIARQKVLLHMDASKETILGICWSKRPNDLRFTTSGLKEIKFWHPADVTKKLVTKGTLQKAPMTNMYCMDFDEEGWGYTGGDNGQVYVWSDACQVVKAIKVHGKRITVVKASGGKVLSGSKDQKVAIISAQGGNFKLDKFVDLGQSFPNSLDFSADGNLLAGLRNGTILEFKNVLGEEEAAPVTLMQSHFDGETWGLELVNGGEKILTCADDNKFMLIDTATFSVEKTGKMAELKSSSTKKSTAATMGVLAPNQQARSVAYSHHHGHIAVSNNFGEVTIRSMEDIDTEIASLTEPDEWNEVMRYSPCGKFLGVGSHDNKVYIYEVQADGSYKLFWTTGEKITSFVTSFDWTVDSAYIRTCSGSHEKQYFHVSEKKYAPDGINETKDAEWHTQTMRFGWDTQGIQRGEDDTHINGVWRTQNGNFLLSVDDWGLLNVYNYPVMDYTHAARSYAGHSEHVVRAVSSEDGKRIYTIGGNDKTIIQWVGKAE